MRTVIAVGLAAAVLLALEGPALQAEQERGNPRQEADAARGSGERLKGLDGTVRAIDRHVKAVRVDDGGAHRRDTVVQVTDNTEIRVGGRRGSLDDVREGHRIRAAYEDRFGINVVSSIEVTADGARERLRPDPGLHSR